MAAPERRLSLVAMAVLASLLTACATGPRQPDPEPRQEVLWEAEAMAWRERRLARLIEPYGWLSLVGLEFLENGQWTLGSAPGNELVVPAGPEHWGQLMVIGTRAWFDVESGATDQVRVDGQSVGSAEIHVGGEQGPTLVEAATVQWQLLERSGRLALRVRDSQATTRTQFAGLDYFPFNPDWRIEARWEAHPPGRTLLIADVLGELIHEPNPGAAEFEFDGRTFGLEAIESGDQLFFILADRTSGRETYGLGRFLYSDLPRDGRVVLDFNRAYNPPCAFTEYSTCPLPPPENRLDTRVEAGELAPKPAYIK
jgi:uncharacterized protein